MTHTQIVQGSNGDWTFILPDQITLTQGDGTGPLVFDGTQQPALVFNVHYDLAAFNNLAGLLTIQVLEPENNADSGFNGLRGTAAFNFFNELGVPIEDGPLGALGIFVQGPGDIDDPATEVYHTTYAHFHGVEETLADTPFGTNTFDSGLAVTPGEYLAPNVITVNGRIPTFATGELWQPVTLHQRQVIDKNDDFTINFYVKPGAVQQTPGQAPVASADFSTSYAVSTNALPHYSFYADMFDPDVGSDALGDILFYAENSIQIGYDDGDQGEYTIYTGDFKFAENANTGHIYLVEGHVSAIYHQYYYHDYSVTPEIYYSGIWQAGSVDITAAEARDLFGQAFGERLFRGDDTLSGSAETDRLFAFAGNDTLIGGAGADELNGGSGSDTASYAGSLSVRINLTNGRGSFGDAEGDVLIGIENIIGSERADTLLGNSGANVINGEGGFDEIHGYAGNDRLYGGNGLDKLFGDFNADMLFGGAGGDTLSGGAGPDKVYGESGNDIIVGDADGSDDIYDGGTDIDTVDYSAVTSAINVNLALNFAMGAPIGIDRIFQVERILAGAGNDKLTGNSFTTLLSGAGGNDVILGGSGDNKLYGGDGNDNLRGFAGFDQFFGGNGNDRMQGDFNADTFIFANGFGKDIIADFEALNAAEKIDLSGVTNITSFADLVANHLTQVGGNAVITDGFNTITLNGVAIGDLDATDFIF